MSLESGRGYLPNKVQQELVKMVSHPGSLLLYNFWITLLIEAPFFISANVSESSHSSDVNSDISLNIIIRQDKKGKTRSKQLENWHKIVSLTGWSMHEAKIRKGDQEMSRWPPLADFACSPIFTLSSMRPKLIHFSLCKQNDYDNIWIHSDYRD